VRLRQSEILSGRQTWAETDRQTASQWNVLLPAATAINLEAAGPCLRSSVDVGRDVSGGERKVYVIYSSKERGHA
jgi:hypothetical protein